MGRKPVEIDQIAIGDLAKALGRLTLGSLMTVLGILASVVTGTLYVAPYVLGAAAESTTVPSHPIVATGEKAGLPYVMPSLVSWARLDRTSGGTLVADQRITYELLALRDFDFDEAVFQESYHSSVTTLQYLPGTDGTNEVLNEPQDQALGWQVKLRMTAGEYRAVMTGVRRSYLEDRMREARKDHAGRTLGASQDEYCYLNEADSIGEIVIGIETTSLSFRDTENGTRAYVFRSGQYLPKEPEFVAQRPGSPVQAVVVARFNDVRRGDTACVVVGW